jgi:hypothetical protein
MEKANQHDFEGSGGSARGVMGEQCYHGSPELAVTLMNDQNPQLHLMLRSCNTSVSRSYLEVEGLVDVG